MTLTVFSPASELTSWRVNAVRTYIKDSWPTLSRSLRHVLQAAQDEKVDHPPGAPWPVYISAQEDFYTVADALLAVLSPEEFAQIDLRVLPADYDQITDHGLLYLPHDYVVPGGRFNEMYGWDSYFIVLGLLWDDELLMAKSMVDQLIYQVRHYGTVLNANRTYMLNRSQPPVLSMMAKAVFQRTGDRDWLQSLLPVIERYYYYWMVPPHFNPVTGLSHYRALGRGPAPEVVSSERDAAGRTHYDRVREHFRDHAVEDYDVSLFYDADTDQLTDLYYQGDRSMRESGFDITNRFGPFSADIIHYSPVCLNVLLYQMEQDIAEFHRCLNHDWEDQIWEARAQHRYQLINQYLWDDQAGLYFDYNAHTGQRRAYEFATTFMPLWAGLASPYQAKRVVDNLWKFEAPGGLLTSTLVSGNQWDAPFGWAPLQWFAVQGLKRNGYHTEAIRLAEKFVQLVAQELERTGTILEKYDVQRCSSEVADDIQFGYSSNEIGFGWTNGVVSDFLALLDPTTQSWANQAA
ncbi:MAG TPA: alpha,alpha-trehalase [Leptolyngbyaceae cyanobacterium M65_K2018_010]|nr:alpha,alpha-trehalase [Leptolyngbyaceae cyanobacterium M65_K2018_010]